MITEVDNSFDGLKDRLRYAYIEARRRKQPAFRGGDPLEKVLEAGVRNCIDAKITPEDYITALYNKYGSVHDQFYPNQLSGAGALRVAREHTAKYEKLQLSKLWDTQLINLKQAITATPRTVEAVLYDHVMPFVPWFRIIATVAVDPKIIKRYGRQAKEELSPEIRTFIKERAPANLDRIENYERYLPQPELR